MIQQSKINYESLYLKSLDLEKNLIEKGFVTAPIRGRFKEYQKEVRKLAVAWRNKQNDNEDGLVTFGGVQVFALKELREILEVLEPAISLFYTQTEYGKSVVRQKMSTILTGPTFTLNEGNNTFARNFQFEFRLAGKLAEAGYGIYFFENPDIVVEVGGRRYAIECKRVTGTSPRVIQANTEEAVEQLIKHKENYYAGILALDVSALLDKRTDLLLSSSIESADKKVLDDIESMLFRDFKRYQKIKRYSYSHLVALIYNFSGSYIIEKENDVGWIQETGILTFNKENPNKSRRFMKDFKRYRDKYSLKLEQAEIN